jgi:hypothetical protein
VDFELYFCRAYTVLPLKQLPTITRQSSTAGQNNETGITFNYKLEKP